MDIEVLKRELSKFMLPVEIEALLSRAMTPTPTQKRRRRARLVAHYRETYQAIQAMPKAKRELPELRFKVIPASTTRDFIVISSSTKTIFLLEQKTVKRTPRTKRLIAQKLPVVKQITAEPVAVFVVDNDDIKLLELKNDSPKRHIPLPPNEPAPPKRVLVRLQGGSACITVDFDEFLMKRRQWLNSPLGNRLEVSVNGSKFFPLSILVPLRRF